MKVHLGDVDRLEAENQDRLSYSDKNIDKSRSHLNLFLRGFDEHGHPILVSDKYSVSLKERILNRIHQEGITIRMDRHPTNDSFVKQGKNKKASVITEGIEFQLSHIRMTELLEFDGVLGEDGRIKRDAKFTERSKTIHFFRDTIIFASQKWGQENIVGGYIHLDEYTPHLHLYVVPIIYKPVNGVTDSLGKPVMKAHLCAKELFSPANVKNLWHEFARAMSAYGVSAAKGLVPKEAYDKVASMEAVMENLQYEIDQLNTTRDNLKALIKKYEQDIRKQKAEIDAIKSSALTLEVPYDYKPELNSLVKIDMNQLETTTTGFLGSQKTIRRPIKEIVRMVSEAQMKYDQKVIGTNAEIHQKEAAKQQARLDIHSDALSAIDRLLAKYPHRGLKKEFLNAGLDEFLPAVFRPIRLLQRIPWFKSFSLQRLVEISEPNNTRSSGMWEDPDIGRFVDKAFLDGSDSNVTYPFKVNLEMLTPDETERIRQYFIPVFRNMPPDVREGIITLANKGSFSLQRILHSAGCMTKDDTYRKLDTVRNNRRNQRLR